MDWITWVLFESLPALAIALGIVLFILLVYWRRGGRPWPLLVAALATLGLLIAQKLVITQREHARMILAPIERGLEEGRVDVLAAALAPEFEAEGLDRERFLDFVRMPVSRMDVRGLDLLSLRTEDSRPDRFTAIAQYQADVSIDHFWTTITSNWAIQFVHKPAGWQITGIKCLALPGHSNPRFTEIRGMQL